jgi:ABC-type nitrate/sulfonate/bicarbonate transport system substrate-binding protein
MSHHRTTQAAVAAIVATLSGAAASAQELVRIGLAVPHNAAYVQFYAAETLGFYKEAGVKAEITIYRGGAASQEALSAGAADIITYFGAGVGLAVSKGAKEKIVAAIDPTPHGWQFLVLANSPIKTLRDLDGKKIGVATKAGTADMFALWVADKGGAKVQTIPVGGGGMVPALRAGQVDAIAMFPGLSLQLLATGEARSLMDLGKDMEPTLPDVIVAPQEMMDKRPQAVRGTLAALYKAVVHMRNNRDWALKYLKEFTEEKDDKVNVLTYEQVVVPLSQDGMVKPEWIGNSINIAAKVWELDDLRKVKPENIYTNAFLPGGPR